MCRDFWAIGKVGKEYGATTSYKPQPLTDGGQSCVSINISAHQNFIQS